MTSVVRLSALDGRRKVGRPSNTSRERILQIARQLFADQGWEVTTNKHVANAAGVSTPALYHYFSSKLDMYLAVYDDVQELVAESLLEPLENLHTFAEQFALVLERSDEVNREDPSIARFVGSARIDAARYAEIGEGLRERSDVGTLIVRKLVTTGMSTGEIDRSRAREVASFVATTMIGLTVAMSDDVRAHRTATDALLLLLRGELFTRGPRG